MSKPIENLRNLGPFMARQLAEIDVHDEAGLRALGAVEAYARLRFQMGRGMSLNALWAMDGALCGIDCRHLPDERKRMLKAQLEERTRIPWDKNRRRDGYSG